MVGNDVLGQGTAWEKNGIVIRIFSLADAEKLVIFHRSLGYDSREMVERRAGLKRDGSPITVMEHFRKEARTHNAEPVNSIVAVAEGKIVAHGYYTEDSLDFAGIHPAYREKEKKLLLFPAIAIILLSLSKKSGVWKAKIRSGHKDGITRTYQRLKDKLRIGLIIKEDPANRNIADITITADDLSGLNQRIINLLTEDLGWRQIRI